MSVSSEKVKQFILDVINQTSFPGSMAEFVADVKKEVQEAAVNQQ